VTDFGPLWGCKSKTGGLSDLRQARAIALAKDKTAETGRFQGFLASFMTGSTRSR